MTWRAEIGDEFLVSQDYIGSMVGIDIPADQPSFATCAIGDHIVLEHESRGKLAIVRVTRVESDRAFDVEAVPE